MATTHTTYKGVRYCKDCGNPDCPQVSADPYWSKCPAEYRRAWSSNPALINCNAVTCITKALG
jgi:hypothetical protein